MLSPVLGASLALAACSEGYPTADEPRDNPFDMTQPERLQAMNRLGREVAVDQRWEYRLAADCTLDVVVWPSDPKRQSLRVPLADTEVSVRFDADAEMYVISVIGVADTATSAEPIAVLEAAKWTDAIRMRSLLRSMRSDCNAAQPGGAADSD